MAEMILGKFATPEARDTALKEIHTKVLGDAVPFTMPTDDDGRNKAYAAYEKALRTPPSNGETKTPPKALIVENPDEILSIGAKDEDPDVEAILAKAGLDATEVSKQYNDRGELTDAQYAALKKVGYGRKIADTLATGQHARAVLSVQRNQAIRSEAVAAVGGEEAFKNLNLWAESNVAPERMKTLNAMVKATPAAYPEVVRMLVAEHTAALGAGKAQPLVTGGATGGATGITTWADVSKLVERAAAGDEAASAQLSMITPEQKAKFK